jgi:DNA-directed RNA polymerase subunit RPC12/RpoP
MSEDRFLDGNSLGGVLYHVFGRDLTADVGQCGNCGAINPIAATHVYRVGPGDVVRCPNCQGVLLVIVETPTTRRVTFELLRWVEISDARGD